MKRIQWVRFTKRTNFPKLGYLMHRLKAARIPCRLSRYESFHAPILEIAGFAEPAAWAILEERYTLSGKASPRGSVTLDDLPDDARCFDMFADETPSHKTP